MKKRNAFALTAIALGFCLVTGLARWSYADGEKMGWLKSRGKKLVEDKADPAKEVNPVVETRGLTDENQSRTAILEDASPALSPTCGEQTTACKTTPKAATNESKASSKYESKRP